MTISIPRINTHWPEQGGHLIGLCPGQNGQPDYWLIASTNPRARFTSVQWHRQCIDIADANSEWDGAANTRAMAEAASELAGAILDLDIEGHRDFYLPARHELRLVKLVAPELIVGDWHWSSTQFSAGHAWSQDFVNGGQYYGDKASKLSAFAVRRASIIQ